MLIMRVGEQSCYCGLSRCCKKCEGCVGAHRTDSLRSAFLESSSFIDDMTPRILFSNASTTAASAVPSNSSVSFVIASPDRSSVSACPSALASGCRSALSAFVSDAPPRSSRAALASSFALALRRSFLSLFNSSPKRLASLSSCCGPVSSTAVCSSLVPFPLLSVCPRTGTAAAALACAESTSTSMAGTTQGAPIPSKAWLF